jgi:tripeptide aminopeptidase
MESVLDRFVRYVQIDTTPDEHQQVSPTSPGQLVLLKQLAEELTAMHAADVKLDDRGVLMATVPATTTKRDVPVIGFIAHVDTSPELPGRAVRPLCHERYDGRDLVVPGDGGVLRAAEHPALRDQLGATVVTASGSTLLGADDKAGVAEIMAAAEYLLARPDLVHGPVRLAFTPDEEIGRGADGFDVERFGAMCAYTVDGGEVGDLEVESFSADAMDVTFLGFNTHPGYARDRMVSAIRMAGAFVDRLPALLLTPDRSDGHDGYVHPHDVSAAVERASVRLLVRDFHTAGLEEKERIAAALAREIASVHGGRVDIHINTQYRNMKEVLDQHPRVVEHAAEAIARAGFQVRTRPIRGGTDGSRLSFMGLPTPNLFAGQHNIHSRLEWTSSRDMEAAVRTIVELCRVWEERS